MSANAAQLYKNFARGLAESDGEDEGSVDVENKEELVESPEVSVVMGGLHPVASDQTATGAFRDSLAQFAAQFAQQQQGQQQEEVQMEPVRKEKKSSKDKKKRQQQPQQDEGTDFAVKVKTCANTITSNSYKKMARVCSCRGVYIVPLLAIVASVMALIATAMDVLPFLASNILRRISLATPLIGINWVLSLIWMSSFAFTATFLTLHVYPVISGSGIPEMRAILSGSSLPQYLKAYVTPVKIIGVLCMISSGLWVGKEGPAVHISCLVGCLVVRMFPVFEPMRKNRTLYRWLLSSCAALGPAAIFGTPIGGVLYAVEATASYFSVMELFYSFVAAVPASLLVRLLHWYYYRQVISLDPIADLVFLSRWPTAGQFFWAMLIAVLLGLIGPLFVELASQIISFRRWVFRKSAFLGNQVFFFFFF